MRVCIHFARKIIKTRNIGYMYYSISWKVFYGHPKIYQSVLFFQELSQEPPAKLISD